MMRGKATKACLLVLLATVLATGSLRPQPARAVDTAVIVVSSIAAYVVFVVGATWLIYTRRQQPLQGFVPQEPARFGDKNERPGLRLAPECQPRDGTMPIAGW